MSKSASPLPAPPPAVRSSRRLALAAALAATLALASGCAEIECATDEDCPGDTVCIGSSLCPPDVTCVWEGEPGVCRPGERILCMGTGGHWDRQSCGHYACGEFPDCDAVVPGCDCGPEANFDRRDGCVEDPTCWGGCGDDLDCAPLQQCHEGECVEPEAVLCMDTGGRWDPTSCGDWVCGAPPLCLAIIPGCDCGTGGVFDPSIGCVASPQCELSCAGGAPCPPGFACDTCPSVCPDDPSLPCPTVCGPAVCRPLADLEPSCADGAPCPPGFACDTCPSVCPDDPSLPCPTVCGPAVCRPLVDFEPSCAGGAPCPPGFGCDPCPSLCPDDPDLACPAVCGPAVCRPLVELEPPVGLP